MKNTATGAFGRVVEGTGSAAGNIKKRVHSQQSSLLGYVPFPGTLNVHFRGESPGRTRLIEEFEARPKIQIMSHFLCVKAEFHGIKCHIAGGKGNPFRSGNCEILAPVRLRDAFGLENEDNILIFIDDNRKFVIQIDGGSK